MKNLLFIIIIFTLYSCEQVGFEQAQPLNSSPLKEFPAAYRGKYVLKLLDLGQKSDKNDTIEIGKNFYQSNEKVKVFLSDTVVLKTFKNYYVFCYKEKKYWTVLLAQQDEKKDILLFSLIDAKGEKTALKLNKITKVKNINKTNSKIRHLINPSKSEFKKIVKHGFFTKMFKLEKFE